MITVAVGYVVIAWMAYLIMVTKTTAPKIWDPYNILDISRVKRSRPWHGHTADTALVL